MFKKLTLRRLTPALTLSAAIVALCTFQIADLQAQTQLFDFWIHENTPTFEVAEGRAIQQSRDGGFACLSKWYGEEGATFTKLDMNGNLQVQRYYLDDPGFDPWSIHQTLPGESTQGYVFAGANTRHRRAIMVKINDSGNLQWFRRLATDGESEARCVDIIEQNSQFFYIMVGSASEPGNSDKTHLLMACFDQFGDPRWSYTFNISDYNDCPVADIRAYSIRQVDQYQFAIVGSARLECPPAMPRQDAFLMKFNFNASSAWQSSINFYEASDYGLTATDLRLACDANNDGYLITGTADELLNPPHTDGFVIRTDAGGNVQWSQIIGNANDDEELFAIEESPDLGAMVVGRTTEAASGSTRIFGMRLLANGDLAWATRLRKPAWPTASQQGAWDMERTSEGTYAIAGYTNCTNATIHRNHTYILHIDDQLCANEDLCYFNLANDLDINTNLIQNIPPPGLVNIDNPDTTIVFYFDFDKNVSFGNECDQRDIHPPLFQYHFNKHRDRGYGGIAYQGNAGGSVQPLYAITGVTGDALDAQDSEMPLVVHTDDGNSITQVVIDFVDNLNQPYGAVGNDIQRTSDDGFVIAGRLINDLGSGSIERNAVMVKTNDAGVPAWEFSVGLRTADHNESFREIRPVPTGAAPDGNGYIAAGYATNNAINRQALVVHADQTGAVQFANTYEVQLREHTVANSIHPVDSDGDGLADNGYIVAGHSLAATGTPANGYSDHDVFVMRLDNSGTALWAKSYSVGDCWATSIIPIDDDSDGAADDGFILCGVVANGTNDFKALVIKLDATGTILWHKVYDRSTNDRAMAIVQREDGTFAFAGVTRYNDIINGVNYLEQVYLVQMDAAGNVDKSQAAPTFLAPFTAAQAQQEDCASDLDALDDGSLFITGSICSFTASAKGDFYTAKTMCDNDCRMQPLNDESVNSPSIQTFVHVIGTCGGATTLCTTDVDNSSWIHNEDASIRVLDDQADPNDPDYLLDHVICNLGEICIPPTSQIVSVPEREPVQGPEIKANPNPVRANSLLAVTTDDDIDQNALFKIHDLSGRLMLEAPAVVAQPEHLLPIGDWPAGVYILTLQAPDGRSSAIKFVVE